MHQSEVTRQGNGVETIKLGKRMKQNNRTEEKNGKRNQGGRRKQRRKIKRFLAGLNSF